MTDESRLRAWARDNVLTAAAAAEYCGLATSSIAGACRRGEIAGAWKWGKRGWLMFRSDVIVWRDSRRKYERAK
jgi:hypothetical protein